MDACIGPRRDRSVHPGDPNEEHRSGFFIGGGRCPSRCIDGWRIRDFLLRNGWVETAKISHADLIILMTCAYCGRTEKASLDALRRLYRKKKRAARLVICGCLPGIDPDALGAFGNADWVLPRDLNAWDRILEPDVSIKEIPEPNTGYLRDLLRSETIRRRLPARVEPSISFLGFCRERLADRLGKKTLKSPSFHLKLGNGCMGNCSYCAIRFATGRFVSKPKHLLLEEFERGLNSGFRHFSIIGQDTGAYGLDIQETFVDLLDSLLTIEGDYRMTISDFNGQWLLRYFDDLMRLLGDHPDRIVEMRIPIQSGSNRILRLMRRPYDIRDIRDRLLRLMRTFPEIAVETHIMVGFPGETEEDFLRSKELVEALDFRDVGVFLYEDRPRTEAADLPDKVSGRTARRRANILSVSARRNRKPQLEIQAPGRRRDIQ